MYKIRSQIIAIILAILVSFLMASAANAAKTVYLRTALTGGAAAALDGIDGAGLLDGDVAIVMASSVSYIYLLDADSAASESSPTVISPDSNAGDKRWVLQPAYGANNLDLLKGTYTDTYLCKYTSSGTLLDCNVDPAGFQAASDILAGLAGVTPANNGIFGYNNSGTLGLYTNHSHDDSAAHYFNTADSTKTFQYDLQYMTTGKKITYQPTAADNYSYKVTITGNTDITMPTSGTLAVSSGALGTPSFTALNMPTSNADPGTTAGQIKHDSTDTGSNSGGTAKWYDGAQVRNLVDTGTNYTLITKTEYLPIRYAEDGTTGPAAAAEISTSTAIGRGFDKDADEDVVFWWVTPNDYVGGIKYRVIYALGADATADDTAVFSLAGCAAANSATLACTPGTAVTLADELGTDDDQYQVMISDYSTAVTVTDIAAGSLNRLVFLRDVSEDDYTEGDLLVIGIEIKYQAKIIGNDGY